METKKETYEAPICTVIEMDAQQVICGSAIHEGLDEDKYDW